MSNIPHSSSSRQTFSWFLLIISNIFWAGSYVSSAYILRDTSLIVMLALRMTLAAVALLPFLIIHRQELVLTRGTLGHLAILSLMGFVINKLLEFGGLQLTSASDVALLISSLSLFVAVLSWIVLRERVRKITVIALVIGFVGVYLVIERSLLPKLPTGHDLWHLIGDLLVVLALIVEAFYNVRGKVLMVKNSPLIIAAVSIVGSVLFWVPAAGWDIAVHGWHPLSFTSWISLLWLALMGTALAYLTWFKGLEKVEASAAATAFFIQPLLGTILAVVFIGDQLTPYTVIGGLLISGSMFLLSRS